MRRSRIAVFVSSILLAAGAALTGASSAQGAQLAATGGYVALGDSYSSGVGAGSYVSSSGNCKRSTKAFPYLWNAAHAPSSFSFNILRLVNMDCARNFGFVSTAKLRAATADMSSHRQLAT